MFKRVLTIVLIGIGFLALSYFGAMYFFSSTRPAIVTDDYVDSEVVSSTPITTSTPPSEASVESINPIATSTKPTQNSGQSSKVVLHDVPFVSQAPLGNWADQRQQDGCEEASVLMAFKWVQGETITKQEAVEEITNMSNWEENTYGSYRDTSAADTLSRLLEEYYEYKAGRVEYEISLADVKYELAEGNILIIPFNGQILDNPNFKPPGPERHMLVAIGYDDTTKEIITNDPGTRLGEGFRYSYDNFEAAFRDYETGDHVPITDERSAMIVVKRLPSP